LDVLLQKAEKQLIASIQTLFWIIDPYTTAVNQTALVTMPLRSEFAIVIY